MRRIYIAGKFSADTDADIENNVQLAESYIVPIAEAGGCPVCPHTCYRNFAHTLDYDRWIVITRCLQEGCDATLLIPDWKLSKGARGESEHARQLAQPCFYVTTPGMLPPELLDWLRREPSLQQQADALYARSLELALQALGPAQLAAFDRRFAGYLR
jgi:hypothetical protein